MYADAFEWGGVRREGVAEPEQITLTARKDQIIFQVVRHVERTRESGLIVPDLAPEPPQRGIVVSVGPDCHELNVGDVIIYQKYDGYVFTVAGAEYQRMDEKDVIAVVEGPAENIWIRLPAYTSDKDRVRWS